MDVVYDAYTTVLKDIPNGKTITFPVKVFLPDGIQELELRTDNDVLTMFSAYEHEDQPIQCSVFGVDVSELSSIDYTVNGFPNLIMCRPNQTMVAKNPLKSPLKCPLKKILVKKTGSGRDFVNSSRKYTPGVSTNRTKDKSANKHHVNLSSGEDCVGDDESIDEECTKAGNESDGNDSETDLDCDDRVDGPIDGDKDCDGKLSYCKSDDLPEEIDR
ncbi:hypothetical protein NE237_012500 [Protea cynaroides]|uniref:Uncharacterized protein n=1 Tax=Protea cynaroides TaxID=273540 RepID=A0A9Q0GWZ1_9MAGN|nr:hypothetical protein NE237_012500 [Protea cynaroides]